MLKISSTHRCVSAEHLVERFRRLENDPELDTLLCQRVLFFDITQFKNDDGNTHFLCLQSVQSIKKSF